jgi:hypothetical protein
MLTAKHVVCAGDEPLANVEVKVDDTTLGALVIPIPNYDAALLRLPQRIQRTPLRLVTTFQGESDTSVRIPGFPNAEVLGTWQTAHIKGPLPNGIFEIGLPTQVPGHLGGLSGAPVLDVNKDVIGIFITHTLEVPDRATFLAVKRFFALLDFSLLPPETLRCMVFIAESGGGPALQLTTAVEAGMKIAGATLNRPYHCEKISINECLADLDRYAATVRQLCGADVAVFDLTSYEPGIMLLLGIRSTVRRGVTIGSIGVPLTASVLADAPFNIKELNLLSHAQPQISGELLESIFGRRIIYGLKALETTPRYRDSVCYDGVRYLLPADRILQTASSGALVLCSYHPSYDKHWEYVSAAIRSHLQQEFPTSSQNVFRSIDQQLKSGRLASETIYSEIRRAEFCIIDWSGWPANVFFEFGVRLAVSRFGAECIIDASFPALPGSSFSKTQTALLINLFRPQQYERGVIGYPPFDKVLKQHLAAVSKSALPTPTYEVASASADIKSDAASVPVYRELLELSNVLGSNDSVGISGLIYPANKKLLKQSEAAVADRLLAAWAFMDTFTLDALMTDPEANEIYLSLCRLVAPIIKDKYPVKAKKMLQTVRKDKRKIS